MQCYLRLALWGGTFPIHFLTLPCCSPGVAREVEQTWSSLPWITAKSDATMFLEYVKRSRRTEEHVCTPQSGADHLHPHFLNLVSFSESRATTAATPIGTPGLTAQSARSMIRRISFLVDLGFPIGAEKTRRTAFLPGQFTTIACQTSKMSKTSLSPPVGVPLQLPRSRTVTPPRQDLGRSAG